MPADDAFEQARVAQVRNAFVLGIAHTACVPQRDVTRMPRGIERCMNGGRHFFGKAGQAHACAIDDGVVLDQFSGLAGGEEF